MVGGFQDSGDFVVLALGGDAPALHVEDLGFGVDVGDGGATVLAADAEDFVGAASEMPDLAVALNGDDVFGIEENGVGFVVVVGQRDAGERVHPGGSVGGPG